MLENHLSQEYKKYGDSILENRKRVVSTDNLNIGELSNQLILIERNRNHYTLMYLKPKPKLEIDETQLSVNFESTHKINFDFEMDMGMFLPSSFDNVESINLINFQNSRRKQNIDFKVYTNKEDIESKLSSIVVPTYFESVILPFISGMPTRYSVKKPDLISQKPQEFIDTFENQTSSIDPGDFVYVGSNDAIYFLGLPLEEGFVTQNSLFSHSTPLFYISTDYLSQSGKSANLQSRFLRKIRGQNPPSFEKNPFICPQMGRNQNSKHLMYHTKPEIITGDITEALDHISSTQFSDYGYLIKRYSRLLDTPLKRRIKKSFEYV